jgi:hypothetical protein
MKLSWRKLTTVSVSVVLLISILSTNGQEYHQFLSPDIQLNQLAPAGPQQQQQERFGVIAYFLFSSLWTITKTTTVSSTSTVTSLVTVSSTCTVSTALVCRRRRRHALFAEDEEPMVIGPSATTSMETTAAPLVEPAQRQARSPQYYSNYWGHERFIQPKYYPVVYQPRYVAPFAYPQIRGSQSSLFRNGYPTDADEEDLIQPAIYMPQERFVKVVKSTTTTTITSGTATTTTTSTTTKYSSVTPTCISIANLGLNYC